MEVSKKFKKNKIDKNFNVAVLHKDFFKLNNEKHFDTYTTTIYMYLIHMLNINFYNNPVEISIRKISKDLSIKKRESITAKLNILKESGLIFWETSENKTYFYFGDLAREKIEEEKKKVAVASVPVRPDVQEKEAAKNILSFFKLRLKPETYTLFKMYTVHAIIEIDNNNKIINFSSDNLFIFDMFKKKVFNLVCNEIQDYEIKLKAG